MSPYVPVLAQLGPGGYSYVSTSCSQHETGSAETSAPLPHRCRQPQLQRGLCAFPRGRSGPEHPGRHRRAPGAAHPHSAGLPGALLRIPEPRRRTQGLGRGARRRELPGATWAESLQPWPASPRRAVPKVTSLDLRVRVSPGTAPADGRVPNEGERRRARPAAPQSGSSTQRPSERRGHGGRGGQGEAAAARHDVGVFSPSNAAAPITDASPWATQRAPVPARLCPPETPATAAGGHLGAGCPA